MGLNLIENHLNGLKVFKPDVYGDNRGFFMESFRKCDLEAVGINEEFVQDNHSASAKNVLRGMHFQYSPAMGKLIRVTHGAALIKEIDIRKNSPTLGRHFSIELSSYNKLVLWVPAGFANGFLSLEDGTEMQYKCTTYWNPNGEGSIRWNDPGVNVDWPVKSPLVSNKDANAISLSDWLEKPESDNFKI